MPIQTVVVAEDDEPIRELVAHHLEREGYSVVRAADGNAALRHARTCGDLLVLDIGLPVVDGHDVMRAAQTDEIDRVIGFELGADDYVCKPFSPRELVARVKAILRRNGQPAPL